MMEQDNLADRVAPRSALKQERSRQRQQALLDAAEEMIAEAGLDGLSMREVGRRAGLPIASVYHYFPSAPAIVRELATRQLARLGALVEHRLSTGEELVKSNIGIQSLAGHIVSDLAAYLAEAKAAPAIWNALRSNPELRLLDRADTIENARNLAPFLTALDPGVSGQVAEALAIVILETVAINLMFAMECTEPQQGAQLAALRLFLSAAIRGLAQGEA